MEIEMHQLELRYAEVRVRDARRAARLLASLAQHGQHTPVVVVAAGIDARYVLIDGYARVEALGRLGRDAVEAMVVEVPEADALLLSFQLDAEQRRSALEQGWLLAELVERHGWTHRAIAARLSRSASWVCRRLALVRELPESVQEAVKGGMVPPHAAEKYLVVLARANKLHCERLVAGLEGAQVTVRQVERLYLGWKRADAQTRQRV